MERPLTIQANHLDEIDISRDASPLRIGAALSSIQTFLKDVWKDGIASDELPVGDQRTAALYEMVVRLHGVAQLFSGSSGLAVPQPIPPQNLRQM